MIVERKGYQTSYGLLRILACIFVIIHHFDAVVVDASSQKGMAVVDNLTMVNNGLFFMLSGKFALEYFDGNVTAYYRKRFVKIVVPYLVINCAINMMHGYTITEYISSLRHGEVYDWFVYAVIGFYLAAPFFYYMFYDMKEKYKLLFLLSIVVYIVMNTVNVYFGSVFYTAANPFFDTLSFFLIGYLIDNIVSLKRYKWYFAGAGIAAACISTYEIIYLPGVNASLYGLCITRICMCAAVYVLVCWSNSRIIQDKNIQKIVKRLANLTYYVYLVHGLIQEPYAALHSYIISKNPYIRLAAGSLEIIAVSFVLAYLYERITRMIYKIAGEKRIWGRLKSN